MSKNILISSNNKQQTEQHYNYNFILPYPINIKSISLNYVMAPILYYNVSNLKQNNIWNFQVLLSTYILTLPDGFYSYNDILNSVNAFFTLNVINATLNYDTLKLKFYLVNNLSNPINIYFNTGVGFYYGFNDSLNLNLPLSTTYSPFCPNLSMPNYIFITFKNFGDNKEICLSNGK
jgi:hypothetical protein